MTSRPLPFDLTLQLSFCRFHERNFAPKLGRQNALENAVFSKDFLTGCGDAQPFQIAISGGRLALPSEGRGHTFKSCRVRHFILQRDMRARTETPALRHSSE
jgi:hypothetical protein